MTTSLTERERSILEILADGYACLYAVADHLESDERGVSLALESAKAKLGALTACHAVALAIRGGHIL